MKFYRGLSAFLICALICSSCSQQTEPPVELVLENEGYPIYRTENVTLGNTRECDCQSLFPEASTWNSWSTCQGQPGAFECHRGIRYRRRTCSEGRVEECTIREWQHCYHESSCTGQWVEWVDPRTNGTCSHSCGGGVFARIRICSRGKDIGLYCASRQRRPYDLEYVPCNNEPCPGVETYEEPLEDLVPPPPPSQSPLPQPQSLPPTPSPPLPQEPVDNSFSPNLLTWTVLGVCVIVILLAVGILAFCLGNKRRTKTTQKEKAVDKEINVATDYQQLNRNGASQGSTQATNNRAAMSSFNTSFEEEKSNTENLPSNSVVARPKDGKPERPPILHHSFHDGQPLPSATAIYTLPSPSTSSAPKKWNSSDDIKAGAYEESRTFFADSFEDKDLPPIPTHPTEYLETINEHPEERHHNTLPAYHNYDIPEESEQSSSPQNGSLKLTRFHSMDNSHVYAEIPLRRL